MIWKKKGVDVVLYILYLKKSAKCVSVFLLEISHALFLKYIFLNITTSYILNEKAHCLTMNQI